MHLDISELWYRSVATDRPKALGIYAGGGLRSCEIRLSCLASATALGLTIAIRLPARSAAAAPEDAAESPVRLRGAMYDPRR